MQLAAYKGPAPTLWLKVVHFAICAVDTVRQSWRHRRLVVVQHSHCELVIEGRCYSASDRDGGVRGKTIDLDSGHWDVFDIDGDEDRALAWFRDHDGDNYDWIGIARFVLPFLPHRRGHWFCSEACGTALGLSAAFRLTPHDLVTRLAPQALA